MRQSWQWYHSITLDSRDIIVIPSQVSWNKGFHIETVLLFIQSYSLLVSFRGQFKWPFNKGILKRMFPCWTFTYILCYLTVVLVLIRCIFPRSNTTVVGHKTRSIWKHLSVKYHESFLVKQYPNQESSKYCYLYMMYS